MISSASDLLLPIEVVSKRLGLTVGVLNPHQRNPSVVLQRDANFFCPIRQGPLSGNQLPATLSPTREGRSEGVAVEPTDASERRNGRPWWRSGASSWSAPL